MSMKLWENLVRSRSSLAYWTFIAVLVAAAVILLLISRGNSRDATSVEATVTAGRVQAATATAEALSPDEDEQDSNREPMATAAAEALLPDEGK